MFDSDIDLYEDPVALLQAEIERLEAELRAREEIAADPVDRGPDEHSVREIGRLQDELALRDETIAELWDHLRHLEEQEAASRVEWEQVQAMIDDLEARLAGQSWTIPIESTRGDDHADRHAWAIERGRLTAEIDRLRADLDRAGNSPVAAEPDDQTAGLLDEVARLRAELQRSSGLETEVEMLRARLRVADENRPPDAPAVSEPSARHQPYDGLSPDERIRALRLHLREVHDKEVEERKSAQLASRLSRLWHSLGRPS